MAEDDVREAAKAVIRRQVWESNRGKATRAFLREHPEVGDEFETTGTITGPGYKLCETCKGLGTVSESGRGSDGPDRCVACKGTGYATCAWCKGAGATEAEETLCGYCKGTGHVQATEYPEYVTRASVLLELNTRARRKEQSATAKQWAKDHPDEVKKLREQVREETAHAG